MATVPLILSSCTVKEDRMPCPCYVDFDPQPGLQFKHHEPFIFVSVDQNNRKPELQTSLKWYEALEKTHNTSVSKGYKSFSVIEGLNMSKIDGTKIIIPYGEQSDSLRCYTEIMNCFRETVVMPVDSTKHFATVTLRINDIEDPEDYPYVLRIRGDVNGFDYHAMEPNWGKFYYEPKMNTRCEFKFRIPRQFENDGYLYIDLCDKENYDIRHDILATIKLNNLMDMMGYDWTRPCLQDIDIALTYAVAYIAITINDWETIIYDEEV